MKFRDFFAFKCLSEKKELLTVEIVAAKHNVPVSDILKQVEMGMEVEKEHYGGEAERKLTALQHLEEVPNYYSKLKAAGL